MFSQASGLVLRDRREDSLPLGPTFRSVPPALTQGDGYTTPRILGRRQWRRGPAAVPGWAAFPRCPQFCSRGRSEQRGERHGASTGRSLVD